VKLYRSDASEATIRRWCTERIALWQVPHTTQVLSTPLGETHLTWAGEGVDTCVYFPGTNFNAATSMTVLGTLARCGRVVCVDLPGQPGLSTGIRPDNELKTIPLWIKEVTDEVRRHSPSGKIVLMGHSRGAAVALMAAAVSVDALILLSPAGLARARITLRVLTRSLTWLLRPSLASARRLVGCLVSGNPSNHESVVEWMALVGHSTRTSGAPGPLPRELLAQWRGSPVAVLVGESDVFFPPRRLARPVRDLDAVLEVASGAGHLLVDECPERVAATLVRVLGQDECQ
jgi:pimeloyl-ACP methyl ester carboxylesterase